MCALVTKCDNLYETNLKDIKLVQRLKSEIDFTKKNFHMKLKSVVLETLSSLINAVIQLRSQEEIERYKAETTKILQESMNNKTFASPSEISTKVAEHVKEHLKVVKVEMAKNSSPAMLGSTVSAIADLITHIEDCLASVVYRLFFLRVDTDNSLEYFRAVCQHNI
jgi:hypothetical protein